MSYRAKVFWLMMGVLISANPKEAFSPVQSDPYHYWNEYLRLFSCNLEDIPEEYNHETIFDNWRFHYGRAR